MPKPFYDHVLAHAFRLRSRHWLVPLARVGGCLAAGLLAVASPALSAELLDVSLNPIDSTSWSLVLTSHVDNLVVQNIVTNHGFCQPQTPIALPQGFKFGESHLVAYFLCLPIDIRLTTNQGPQEDQISSAVDAGVSVDKTFDGSLHEIVVTAHEDRLKVKKIVMNHGNCPFIVTASPDHDGPQGTLSFGQRELLIPECDPVAVQVTTDLGVGIFDW